MNVIGVNRLTTHRFQVGMLAKSAPRADTGSRVYLGQFVGVTDVSRIPDVLMARHCPLPRVESVPPF